jgi:tetratricopeptide (TPR) repeat protein
MTTILRRGLATSAAALAALAFAGTLTAAAADPAKAKQLYDDGEKSYNLGQFDKAIELFTKAYEEWPEPAFLFNIAQAYRQSGNCKQALFFYKRFLSLKENDSKKPIKPEVKKDVEGRIAELEECVKRDIANKPPDALDNGQGGTTTSGGGTTSGGTKPPGGGTKTPGGGTTTSGGTKTPGGGTTTSGGTKTPGGGTRVAGGGDADTDTDTDTDTDHDTGVATTWSLASPKRISAHLTAGPAKISAGNLVTPMQFAITASGGYPIQVAPKIEVDAGAAISYTPVPYTFTDNSGSATGAWWSLLANGGVSYAVAPKIAVRGDLGLGMLVFSGLKEMKNPFTDGGRPATGGLSVFNVRISPSADYAITPNLTANAGIAFAYSPAPKDFAAGVSSLTNFSFFVGVGYRM